MPEEVPRYPADLLHRARDLAYPDLAVEVLAPYTEGVFSRSALEEICRDAYDFDVPLERVRASRHLMRLDRGPTASFKTSRLGSWGEPSAGSSPSAGRIS